MLLSSEKLTEACANLVERIADTADSELAEIAEVFVIAAVHYGTTDDGNGDVGSLFYNCSSGRGYIQKGLLEEARRAVEANYQPVEDE